MQKEIKDTVNKINKNRTEILNKFMEAFISATAPKDVTPEWIMKNCVLCMEHVYKDGRIIDRYWIELRSTK